MLPAEPSYHCHSHITDKKTEIRSSEEAVGWGGGVWRHRPGIPASQELRNKRSVESSPAWATN